MNQRHIVVIGGGPLGGHRRTYSWNGRRWKAVEIEFGFQSMAGVKADETPYEIEFGDSNAREILKDFGVDPSLFPELGVVEHLSPVVLAALAHE